MATEATGTVQSIEKGWITISGERYKVLDYVEPFAARRQVGDDVDFQFTIGNDGQTRALTKITAARKSTDKLPPKKPEEKEVSAVFWKSDGVNVALRGFLDGKTRLFCMTPPIAERMKEAVTGQKIKLLVSKDSFVVRFTLGEILSQDEIDKIQIQPVTKTPIPEAPAKPDTEFKTGAEIAKENLDQLTGPALAPATAAPPQQANPEETSKDSTSPSPLRTWSGVTTLTIGVTVNLDNYENLRLEVSGAAADRAQLIKYLDETLGKFGLKHPATRERIDTYCKRVLA